MVMSFLFVSIEAGKFLTADGVFFFLVPPCRRLMGSSWPNRPNLYGLASQIQYVVESDDEL